MGPLARCELRLFPEHIGLARGVAANAFGIPLGSAAKNVRISLGLGKEPYRLGLSGQQGLLHVMSPSDGEDDDDDTAEAGEKEQKRGESGCAQDGKW